LAKRHPSLVDRYIHTKVSLLKYIEKLRMFR